MRAAPARGVDAHAPARAQCALWLPSAAPPKPLPSAPALAASVKAHVLGWAGARVRCEAGADAMARAAARAEERRWVEAELEEAEALAEVAEGVWGDLLADAAGALLELDAAP